MVLGVERHSQESMGAIILAMAMNQFFMGVGCAANLPNRRNLCLSTGVMNVFGFPWGLVWGDM